jgi:hypothetical protein
VLRACCVSVFGAAACTVQRKCAFAGGTQARIVASMPAVEIRSRATLVTVLLPSVLRKAPVS